MHLLVFYELIRPYRQSFRALDSLLSQPQDFWCAGSFIVLLRADLRAGKENGGPGTSSSSVYLGWS